MDANIPVPLAPKRPTTFCEAPTMLNNMHRVQLFARESEADKCRPMKRRLKDMMDDLTRDWINTEAPPVRVVARKLSN
jgi:hypothetical protein